MSQSARIAVLSRSFSRHPTLRDELTARYADVRLNSGDTPLVGRELADFLADRDAAIVALESITGELLDAVPKLKVISKYGVGCDNIDLPACAARGVRVGWTGGVNRRSVAELTIAFMIAILRKLGCATQLVRDGGWQQVRGRQLSERSVGIIGLGHVGQDVVKLLRPFGCQLLGSDVRDVSAFALAQGVTLLPLRAVLERADVLSLHVPLTALTRGMIDRAAISCMPRDAVIVNTSRGAVVDEAALVDALASGRLSGAALDVFQVEPPADLTLARLPNVIATPHIGGSTEEAVVAMGRAAIAGLETTRDAQELITEFAFDY